MVEKKIEAVGVIKDFMDVINAFANSINEKLISNDYSGVSFDDGVISKIIKTAKNVCPYFSNSRFNHNEFVDMIVDSLNRYYKVNNIGIMLNWYKDERGYYNIHPNKE